MLTSVSIANFRCIERAEFQPHSQRTLIVGENGSGKTSLLEAVFTLGHGRSFRSPSLSPLIRRGTESFTLVAEVSSELGIPSTLGFQAGRTSKALRVNGSNAKGFADVAHLVPVRIIGPEIHFLIEGGPKVRRRYLDWGLFHVEPRFIPVWRRFHRALQQRNAALKQRLGSAHESLWETEFVEAGEQFHQLRTGYVRLLIPQLMRFAQQLLRAEVTFTYHPGWASDLSLGQAMEASRARDQSTGLTHSGPHRAELAIRAAGAPAKEVISRGQQKLLACALVLGQLAQAHEANAAKACLLIDDPLAELDVDNLGILVSALAGIPTQQVVTALQPEAAELLDPQRMFHVERGSVRAML
jgi:DNA replication and repair protein RecF